MPLYLRHAAALRHALKDLNDHVREVPPGSNTGPRVRQMQAHTWLGGTGWPWCVAACVTWLEEAGFKLPYKGAGAFQFLRAYERLGWSCPLHKAVPGDVIVWNLGSGHASMLASPWQPGQLVHTIDGNSGDRVVARWRDKGLVRGVVHLPEKAMVLEKRPRVWEVVGSESGHRVLYVSDARAVGRKLAELLGKHPAGVTIRRRKPAGRDG